MTVRFGVLGDVQARANGQLIELGPARQRCVLAGLLVDANQPVPVDQLAERVWGQHPPQRGLETLYSYLSRLRGVLAGRRGVGLTRRPGGYVLEVDPDAVDIHRFRRLAARARVVDDEEQALALLGEALHLWRGTAFGTMGHAMGQRHPPRPARRTGRGRVGPDRPAAAPRRPRRVAR